MSHTTPGPWHTAGKPNALGTFTVFHGHGEGPHNQVCQTPYLDDANAIAALPDTLLACEAIVHAVRMNDSALMAVAGILAEAAIAKADGTKS